jgi:Ca2+-binding EF-hand superfamily protein
MIRINTLLVSFALLLGACDSPDADEIAAANAEANDETVTRAPAKHGKRGGKLARLDADKDGAISLSEAKGTRLADKFSTLDRDADGELTRDELRAMAGKHGKHGKRGEGRGVGEDRKVKDPAARAAKLLEKRDADKNGALSLAELEGSRMAGKFAAIDTNKDGSLARDELMAMKGRGHGPRGDGESRRGKDPGERAAKLLERRDADKNGALSPAELEGSRMAGKFAALDADKNGAVSRDELVAFKTAHVRNPAE